MVRTVSNSRVGWGLVAFAVSTLVTTWDAPRARASACGSFSADSGDNLIIVGEKTGYFWYDGQYWFYGTGELALCWKDSSAVYNYEEYANCDTTSSSSDYLFVQAKAGDDVLVPNTTGHNCEGADISTYIDPFDDASWDFYLYAYMGTGSDRAIGSGNGDRLYSNTYGSFPSNLPSDSAVDTLCGAGGDDYLYGDHDDGSTYYEFLHGGSGSDLCNGGQDGTTHDLAHQYTCETIQFAASTSIDWGGCGGEPQSYW
jgi:hypothetical protein